MLTHQYKDTKGQVWTLNVNIGDYLNIKNKLGIDIAESFDNDNNWMAVIAAHENLSLLLSMIDILTAGERETRGMTLDQMYEGIDGDIVADATEAMIEAVVLFLPAHKRKALRLIVDSVKVGMEKAVEHQERAATEMLEKIPALVEKTLKEQDLKRSELSQ